MCESVGRMSKVRAQENRRRVVEAAARLFAERGVAGVSVAEVMAEAGMTHGGFYKQFASKEALVTEAVRFAFAEQESVIAAFGEPGSGAAREGLLDHCLATAHRDRAGRGCPCADFAGDLVRGWHGARRAYADGVEACARYLGHDGEEDLRAVSMLVGAVILSRATVGTELSQRILSAACTAFSAGVDGAPGGLPHREDVISQRKV